MKNVSASIPSVEYYFATVPHTLSAYHQNQHLGLLSLQTHIPDISEESNFSIPPGFFPVFFPFLRYFCNTRSHPGSFWQFPHCILCSFLKWDKSDLIFVFHLKDCPVVLCPTGAGFDKKSNEMFRN